MKKIIFSIISILLIIICLFIFKYISNSNIEIKDSEKPVAMISYSYMLGVDSGREYIIDIYEYKKYFKYKMIEEKITISGTDIIDTKKGLIKSRKDLIKLDKYYKSKGKLDENIDIMYRIKNSKELDNIDDFVKGIFDDKLIDKSESDMFSEKELNDMEYVDNKISELFKSDKFKNSNMDEKIILTNNLLEELKNDKYINSYYYEKSSFFYSFEYSCGVSGGALLKDFDPMLN